MTNVRLAISADRDAAVELVRSLLTELGAAPPLAAEYAPTYDRIISDETVGFIAIGEHDGRIVSVCTVSYLDALRTLGSYAIIQEMFVEPEYRSTGMGMEVLKFALDHAVANGCQTVELGTPYQGDRQIQFYERAGFTKVGARLRWRAQQ